MLFLCTGCFDIYEEYNFKKDGSGTAIYKIDMSGMMEMMGSFGDELNSEEPGASDSLDAMFKKNEMITAIQDVAGISNVEDLNDPEKFILGVKFDFADIASLNEANKRNSGAQAITSSVGAEGNGDSPGKRFSMKGKNFIIERVGEPSEKKEELSEEDKSMQEMAKMMFGDAKYEVRYTFEQGVKKVKKSPDAVISDNKQTVIYDLKLVDLMDEKASLWGTIKLR